LFLLFFLASNAYAMDSLGGGGGGGTGGGTGGGGGLNIIIPLLLIMVVFYFLLIRPQQRAEKKRKEMLGNLRKGYRVITAGGLRGIVSKVHDKEKIVVVTIAPGVDVEVALVKIEAAAPPGEPLTADEGASAGRKDEKKEVAKESDRDAAIGDTGKPVKRPRKTR
jgi:preprotein translocase subunit YajC